MPRRARVVVPGLPHHITARGNNRQDVFFVDADRRFYLDVLADYCRQYGLRVEAYCLMTNHVHVVGVPRDGRSLELAIGRTQLRYAMYVNRLHERGGHLWEDRFFSCPLGPAHHERTLRYVERNPVRVVEGTLAGSTLPARIMRFLLGVVRMADTFTGGAVSDLLKVLMIEMLGDQSFVEESLVQFDPGFAEVIIGDRNQIVIDDLRQLVRQEKDVRSVAVLYGAGHMPDLDRRLREQLGYERTGRRWFRAIEVDLRESAVSQREVQQLRLMVRRMMRQMR